MANSFTSSTVFNARHKNNRRDGSPSPAGLSGDEKVKANPWKQISVPENNALEADAWPEPSAGESRRVVNSKPNDEKPKRKIKWQNFDEEGSSYAYTRGRGRYSGIQLNTPYVSSNPTNNFRRGSGYRPRVLDQSRGRGSFNQRNTNKVYPFRLGGEPRQDKSTPEVTTNILPDANKLVDEMKKISIESVDGASDDVDTATVTNTSPNEVNDIPQHSTSTLATSKRSYRDRIFGTAHNASQGHSTFAYEAGPVGRARRSYLRQHPSFPMDQEVTVQHPLISMPLLPFQGVPPVTYLIPGMNGALLGPGGMPMAPGIPANISISSETSGAYISDQVSTHHHVSNNQHATKPITDQMGANAQLTVARHSSTPTNEIAVEIKTVVVDVVHMMEFINTIGWEHVSFPKSLLDHAPVAAAIRSLGTAAAVVDALSQNKESDTASSTDEDGTNPTTKPEDVVIVENKVFFVPRNVNCTKFLKFFSKSDYIRHHIEYYFSDLNLQRDSHLQLILSRNKNVCPVGDLLQFNRLRWANTTEAELLDAVTHSSRLTTISTENNPLAIARVFTPVTEATISEVITSHSQTCSNVEKPTEGVVASTSLSTSQQPSNLISATSSVVGSVGSQSSGHQSFIQPQSYFPTTRTEATDTFSVMGISYAAGTNNHLGHLAGNVPNAGSFSAQYCTNQLDQSAVPQPTTTIHSVSINQSTNLFSGNRNPTFSAYSGGGPPTYLAVPQNLTTLQAVADPTTASLMTALCRVGAASGVPGNIGGTYLPTLGNTGNVVTPGYAGNTIASGYAGQHNTGSALLVQLVPGATHPSTAGYYTNGSQAAGVPGPALFTRGIQNTVNPPNVWIPLGAVSQNVAGASSMIHGSHSHANSNSLNPVVGFQPTAMTAASIPLTTTASGCTHSAAAIYPTMLPQLPIPVNAFALVPNPTMESNMNTGAVGGGNGPNTLLAGTSEAGHQRPINPNNGTYLLANHSVPPTVGSTRSSGIPHSLPEGTNHTISKKPAGGSNENAGTGHSGHS